ncbi:hypothetical protein HGO21_08440 [Acinetobacter sp. CUI P1]|uniref:hypothetical protein n=1 Tax=Paenibacillus sp. FSL E2-0201 TaxID=2954726 RepID=UPI001E132197|nr:hypothetical protein [Acinetobacter sp. CUI P1]
MALLEYFSAKLAKKNLTKADALTTHTAKAIAGELVKIPFAILKAVIVGILKWALWTFNELVPSWIRVLLFFVFIYFLVLAISQFVGHGGFPQVVDEVVTLLTT